MLKVVCHNLATPPETGDEPCTLLGSIQFENRSLDVFAGGVDTAAHVSMPVLNGCESMSESFFSSAAVQADRHGEIHYRFDDQLLFGVITLDEADFGDTENSPLQAASSTAYEQIFSLLARAGFPFVLRFWNYMADINGASHGLERYRQFNLGRQQAFAAHKKEGVANVPAACALGMSTGPLTVAFLAARAPALPIENPRQVSAYDYPVQYGPRAPLFSRASVAPINGSSWLFLSGTASIVGHTTLHAGDVRAQTAESLDNVAAVLAEARNKTGKSFPLSSLDFIVYIRNRLDLPHVQKVVERRVGTATKVTYLQADICRADLMVEIEGSVELR